MSNVLTRNEIVEQYGEIVLTFTTYVNHMFIFGGADNKGTSITAIVDQHYMECVNIDMGKLKVIDCVDDLFSFLVIDKDLNIVYEDNIS